MDSAIRPKRERLVIETVTWRFLDLQLQLFLAMKVGVPVVPGTPGPVAAYSDGDSFIKEYGFPGEY